MKELHTAYGRPADTRSPHQVICNAVVDPQLARVIDVAGEHIDTLAAQHCRLATVNRSVLFALTLADLLRASGYPEARAVPVSALCLNPVAVEWQECVDRLDEQTPRQLIREYKERGAYAVYLGPGDGRMGCHFATIAGNHLIDLALGQVSRPERQLALGGFAVPLQDSSPDGVPPPLSSLYTPDGALILWEAVEDDDAYRRLPEAQQQRRIRLVRELLLKLQEAGMVPPISKGPLFIDVKQNSKKGLRQ